MGQHSPHLESSGKLAAIPFIMGEVSLHRGPDRTKAESSSASAGTAPPPSFCEHPLIFLEAAESPHPTTPDQNVKDIHSEGSEQCRNV